MDTARFLGTAVALFLAVFLGMKWMLTVKPLQPDARIPTFHRVDKDSAEYKLQQSSVSDNDPTRDRLRNEVMDYAKALADDPCNQILKANYIKAAVAYVRAWIAIVPCLGTQSCRGTDSTLLDRGAQAFGSPLDLRVREAMQRVHAKAVFGSADFPKDTVFMVAGLAADASINSVAETREFRHVSSQFGDDTRQDCGH
jgi:hypothetical protein